MNGCLSRQLAHTPSRNHDDGEARHYEPQSSSQTSLPSPCVPVLQFHLVRTMPDPDSDVHNFPPSSSHHRLPTISGVEALQAVTVKARAIPTSLDTLDSYLLPINALPRAASGIQRGHVTEIFGPPGAGKTALGLQLACNALHSSPNPAEVLWINGGSPLVEERFDSIFIQSHDPSDPSRASSPQQPDPNLGLLSEHLTYLEVNTLPRLLTIFAHPTAELPSPKTALIVVDDISNIVSGSLLRRSKPSPNGSEPPPGIQEKLARNAASKRFRVIETLASAMAKLAALRNLALVVLTNSTTNFKAGQKASLRPALASQAWDSSIHARIMLYYDFPPLPQEPSSEYSLSIYGLARLRYAEVQRLSGRDVYLPAVPFLITESGLEELAVPDFMPSTECFAPVAGYEDKTEAPTSPTRPSLSAPLLLEPGQLPYLPLKVEPSQSDKRKFDELTDGDDTSQSETEIETENAADQILDTEHSWPENQRPTSGPHDGSHSHWQLPALQHHPRHEARTQLDLPSVTFPMSPQTHHALSPSTTSLSPDQHMSQDQCGVDNGDIHSQMILDLHETAILRRYRYAVIRGSEDAAPVSSSPSASGTSPSLVLDYEAEVPDSQDEAEELINLPTP